MPETGERRIEYVPLDEVQPAVRNAKRHDLDAIRASVGRFGAVSPAVRDERTGRLVVGHGRTDALRTMRDAGETPPSGVRLSPDGAWLVPVLAGWASRSDVEAEAYLVADNRHTELGGWDDGGLAEVLSGLDEADPALLEVAGYSQGDLETLLAGLEPDVTHLPPALADPEHMPEVPVDPVTKPGDVWLLGEHRIVCGDCRDFGVVETLLAGARINVAFTSPPYASQRVYDESSGFRPIRPDGYVDWFEDVQANIRAVLADDGSWFVNIKEHCEDGQRHLYVKDLTIAHVRRWGWRFVDELCWVDSGDGFPGSFPNRFKDAWEPVFHFAADKKLKLNPLANGHESMGAFKYSTESRMALGDRGGGVVHGAERATVQGFARPSNVIHIAAGGGNGHSAAFPVALPAWFIRAYSDPDNTVFDPFMGSGSTLIAAHQEGRVAYGCEVSAAYTDIIARRYQTVTGEKPVLASTGEPVDFCTGGDDG